MPLTKYRLEIDGIRAIAVIPVILYHISDSILSSGFLGVDVFFVISGYLITSIISMQIHDGTFSLSKFYLRRARRILPVAYIVLLLSMVTGFVVLLPDDLQNLSQALLSIIGFGANIFFYFEVDYFNHFANNNPLLHFWSLSVEEQFYFLVPGVFLMIGKRKRLLTFFLLLIFFGTIYAYYQNIGHDDQLAFYSLHTRAWQLTMGALIARVRPLSLDSPFNNVVADIISSASLVLVICSYFGVFDIFEGSSGLFISFFASFLILAVREDSIVGSILKFRILSQLGLLSYSLYLIHNPVFELLEYVYDLEGNSKLLIFKCFSVLFVLQLARLSYKYVESPMRNESIISNKMALFGLVSASALIISFGLIGHLTGGFENIKSNGILLLADEKIELEEIRKVRNIYGNVFNPNGTIKIKVFGDSFAQDAYYSLCKYLTEKENYNYCLELIDYEDSYYCNSEDIPDLMFEADILIFSNYWQEQCYQEAVSLMNNLNDNRRVFFVTSSAYPRMKSLSIMNKHKDFTLSDLESFAFRNQRWDRLRTSQDMEKMLLNEVGRINRSEFFSGGAGDTVNLFDSQGRPLIWDNAHLTLRAYSNYGKFLFEKIEAVHKLHSLK